MTASSALAERYALALFDLAEQSKSLDKTAEELKDLGDLITGNADLRRLIRSPMFSRADQKAAMAAVLKAAGASKLTGKFIGVLAENRRLFALPEIIRAFLQMLASRRNETLAEVTSAAALSKSQLAAVTDALKKVIGKGVVVSTRVDPELLGGLVVRVGSRMFDSSLKTKLKRMSLAMKGIG